MKWSNLKFWRSSRGVELKSIDGLPSVKDRFKAFDLTPFDEVKCVLLGQDPYSTKSYAHGLAFSVQPHIDPLPPSLRNILGEYAQDTGHELPRSGCLERWASNGVLLLNSILTVEHGKPLSHAGIGWEKLTYEVLSRLSHERSGIVFMLWGKKAQEYRGCIDETKHLVLTAAHPSPLAGDKFRGCEHFTLANKYRRKEGLEPINWRL